ncbi:pyrroline-5-carboxylate reductase family protein [Sphingomonas prati]|uniref:Pyrroline-5-carboxylate reductase n=1 Tax=Sphingomonas prati TaxID=1843237 RepID=A0A7W9F091_9SPHN|nr:pyrroline-5-carboxylate reductase dimerization domain-containing protein [Sphingomonas prati]MBB5728132.1 pyrroline-5-carboxylate reductase [Sphingomonas prati]GGE83497.1 pyrroline-5-carboxylate reductase [Sphingomonas prati]
MSFGSIWAVGAGNMGGAMLRRWLTTGLDPARLTVIRKSGAAFAEGVATLSAVPADGDAPELLLLGVKPQMLDLVAGPLAAAMRPGTVLVSILAGVEDAALRARFPGARIVRAMPNLPVAIGQGVVGLHMVDDEPELRAAIDELMAPLGLVAWMDDAAAMDVVAAVAGSGPAFLYRFVDALAAAGVAAGLPVEQSAELALATVVGAAAQAGASDVGPAEMAERVASPGGSTRKGLDVLDGDAGLGALMTRTIAAAVARNREMAAAAR